jgi:hypothetical protein
MGCRYRVLLRCPTCLRVFCVHELAGTSVVWHGECEGACERIASADQAEHADRVGVCYYRDKDRLEVARGTS